METTPDKTAKKREFPSLYSLDPKEATIADVKKCLEAGGDPNEIDDNGEWGAISFLAIHGNNRPLIRYLLRTCKPKKLSSFKNNTPLLAVVRNQDIIETLIQYGIDVNETDDDGRTALWLLSSDPTSGEIIIHLLRHGADIDKADKQGVTPLENAMTVDEGRKTEDGYEYGPDSVFELLLENGASVRRETLDIIAGLPYNASLVYIRMSRLFRHTAINRADMISAYRRSSVEYNREHAEDLGTRHWDGYYYGDSFEADWVFERPDNPFWKLDFKTATVEETKKVLDEGGDPHVPNYDGPCSAYLLRVSRHPETAAYLLNRYKDIDFINHEAGEGDYARILGQVENPEILDMMADYAPYLLEETPNVTNNTLYEAVFRFGPERLRHLIRLGVNVNPSFQRHIDTDQELGRHACSAFEGAIGLENPDIVNPLLKAGADVDKKSVLGELSTADYPVKYAELLLSTGLFTVDELLKEVEKPWEYKDYSVYETYRQTETNVEDIRTDVLDSIMIVNALKYGRSRRIVPFLVKALKGDMNQRNSNWETPLMIAVSTHHDNSAVVRKLLAAGADPTMKNNDGKTVYEMDMDPGTKRCLNRFKSGKKGPPKRSPR